MHNESPEFREHIAAHVERLAAMYPMLEAAGIPVVDGDQHPCEVFIRHRAERHGAQGRAAPVSSNS